MDKPRLPPLIQRIDFMKYFAKDRPAVKLCALGLIVLPSTLTALAIVWRLLH